MVLLALAACTFEPEGGTYIGDVRDFVAEGPCEEVWGFDLEELQAANATDVQIADDGRVRGYDAYVETRTVVAGEWLASYAFESEWQVQTTCTSGTDCATVESCLITWTFDPTLLE